jgi:hypothetical protein
VGEAGTLGGVIGALSAGPALLVLDNCEQVVAGVAEVVRALVSRTGELRVLATSRAPLGLSSESVYPLPELDLATSVELFLQRARAARPGAELPLHGVRELCRKLDGLPLAVELAAARIRVMSVAEIGHRLDDRFALLRGGPRDAPQRHRTLHAVIDWSWHLLAPDGQEAMRALAVFPGGFTADAARHVVGDDAVVERLVDQSLLKVVDSPGGTRFRMLETVREFSLARHEFSLARHEVGVAGREVAPVDRFLAWARDLAAGMDYAGDLMAAVELIRAEQDNLVGALRYGLDRHDEETIAGCAALLGALWLVDSNIGRLTGLAAEVPAALATFQPAPRFVEPTRAAGVWSALIGFLNRAEPVEAVGLLRRLPSPDPDTLIGAAQTALCVVDPAELKELGNSARPRVAAMANYADSYLAEHGNDLAAALAAARRMLDRVDGADPWLQALAHSRIGEVCLHASPGDEAHRHINAALSIMESLGAWSSAARARWGLVLADLQRGALDQAEEGLERLARGVLVEDAGPMMFDLCTRAEVLLGRGDVDGGLRLWRQAADGLRSSPRMWALEVQAVTVVAHCRRGRLDLVAGLAETLPNRLSAMLPVVSVAEFRYCGVLLVALANICVERGATAPAVRRLALAERFGFSSTFHRVLSVDHVRDPNRPAYTAAVAEYAGLDHEGLRAAALRLVSEREE